MDEQRMNRTNDEIEALLREGASGEIGEGTGRVAARVTSRIRSSGALRSWSASAVLAADEGGVPRWFAVAAVLAIAVGFGWLVFGGAGGAGAPADLAPIVAEETASEEAEGWLARAEGLFLEVRQRPDEAIRHEARALVDAAGELAIRVLEGMPAELLRTRVEEKG